jgi:hypothetical protein
MIPLHVTLGFLNCGRHKNDRRDEQLLPLPNYHSRTIRSLLILRSRKFCSQYKCLLITNLSYHQLESMSSENKPLLGAADEANHFRRLKAYQP